MADQTGAPADPQAGNIPGGKRDVLRSASSTPARSRCSRLTAGGGRSPAAAIRWSLNTGGDALAVFNVDKYIPNYFEMLATIRAVKPIAGYKANAYLVFDYQSATDFKFAGINISTSVRDASGWKVRRAAAGWRSSTLLVNNQHYFSHTFAPRVVDGYSYGLNWGYVGVGSDNSRGTFDNVRVQVLPPQVTFESLEDFSDGVADLFTGETIGTWAVTGERYVTTPAGGAAISLMDLGLPGGLNPSSYLEVAAKLTTAGRAGIVFDRYGEESFKFAAIDAATDQVLIGHWTAKRGFVIDAAVSRLIADNVEYTLGVALKGATVSVTLGGQVVLGHVFNASTVDGDFGLLAIGAGESQFDDVQVKTNDPAFVAEPTSHMLASPHFLTGDVATNTLTLADIDTVAASRSPSGPSRSARRIRDLRVSLTCAWR
jgi:hypothetical protein